MINMNILLIFIQIKHWFEESDLPIEKLSPGYLINWYTGKDNRNNIHWSTAFFSQVVLSVLSFISTKQNQRSEESRNSANDSTRHIYIDFFLEY